jgi:glutamate-1-semialdehyde aminotransferase
VLIFDEVMTGFRLARGGVQEIEKITPDLTTLGKIIGGGLPVGAFGGRADIMDQLAPLGPVYQAGTLSGNPLAMAAGIASLQLLDEVKPYARLDALGRQVCTAALAVAKAKGLPLQAPQAGSMFSLFFTPNAGARHTHRPRLRRQALRPLLPRLPRRRRLSAAKRLRVMVPEHRPRGRGHRPGLRCHHEGH